METPRKKIQRQPHDCKNGHALAMGEFLCRTASAYKSSKDEKVLNGMLDRLNKTTAQARAAIDEALAFVDASNKRIEAMERRVP
jgi:hypothetical protein